MKAKCAHMRIRQSANSNSWYPELKIQVWAVQVKCFVVVPQCRGTSLNETTSNFSAGVQTLAGVSDLFHPPKTTRWAMGPCPCPSSCLCPCQLVKVDFMACRCFLYDSDSVCKKSADPTMWGQRKPKGGNLKTTPPSEIFKTAARGEKEQGEEKKVKEEWMRGAGGARMWLKRERNSGVYIY